MLQPIDQTLTQWADPRTSLAERWKQVSDLAEAVQRHGDFGCHPPYSFHDRAIEAGPTRLRSEQLRRIAQEAGRVLLDPTEAEAMRVSAAFLLGKTHQKSGLAAVISLIGNEARLPLSLVRQCAFTFDLLGHAYDFGAMGVNLDAVGDYFEQYGIPWDRASGRVDVTLL